MTMVVDVYWQWERECKGGGNVRREEVYNVMHMYSQIQVGGGGGNSMGGGVAIRP